MEPAGHQQLKNELRIQEKANVEIRDSLAIERTQFANERTFLAYMRTSMVFILSGFSLIQFFRDQVFMWVGVLFIPAGILLSIIGLKKFITKRASIEKQRLSYKPTSPMHARAAANIQRPAARFRNPEGRA